MSALNSWSMKIEEENKMKIVAVAACTIGIAHTYMAQEASNRSAKSAVMNARWKHRAVWELKMNWMRMK